MVKIGIISDTHDDIANVKNAINIFNETKVSCVIHAGDYVFPGIVNEFNQVNAKIIGVFGNNDGEKIGLLKNFNKIGGELYGEFAYVTIDGLKIGVYHGTNNELTETIIKSQLYDLVVCGHTHKKREEKIGNTLVLNPGTACRDFPNIDGKIETEPTVVILDIITKSYQFIKL